MTSNVTIKKVTQENDDIKKNKQPLEENAVRFELKQAMIDDVNAEQNLVSHIIFLSNHLYQVVTELSFLSEKEQLTRQSMQASIKREASQINTFLDQFLETKLRNNEKQHAIIKRFKKVLKKKL